VGPQQTPAKMQTMLPQRLPLRRASALPHRAPSLHAVCPDARAPWRSGAPSREVVDRRQLLGGLAVGLATAPGTSSQAQASAFVQEVVREPSQLLQPSAPSSSSSPLAEPPPPTYVTANGRVVASELRAAALGPGGWVGWVPGRAGSPWIHPPPSAHARGTLRRSRRPARRLAEGHRLVASGQGHPRGRERGDRVERWRHRGGPARRRARPGRQ
jgi:hypothetical protein